jgi:hypothetical protein
LLGTLFIGLSPYNSFCLIVGSITSLRIKYIKGLSLKEKVVELDEIERAGERDRFSDGVGRRSEEGSKYR